MSLPAGTVARGEPHAVEYRQRSGAGVRVVRVSFATGEARIQAWTEIVRTVLEVEPMALFITEVIMYVNDASRRLGVSPAVTVTPGVKVVSKQPIERAKP